MKAFRQYPDYIHIARLKDIFWNNNSDLYPNTVPSINQYTRLDNIRPVFQSPYMGTIVLKGEYNHCIYDGLYYQLVKLEIKDVANEEYKYQLIVDAVLNFLLIGGEIKGTLIRSNNPDILAKVIPTTQPVLSSPAILKYISFKEEKKFNWQEECKVILPPEDLYPKLWQPYITYKEWASLVKRTEVSLWGKKLKEWKFKDEADRSTVERAHVVNPLYIVDYLPTIRYYSWKNIILDDFKKNFSSLKNKVITIQTQIQGSFFQGKKAVSWQEDSIGTNVESNLQITSIDLSKLTDIEPIDAFGQPIEPSITASYDDLLDDDIPSVYEPFCAIKLGRTPYLPFNNGQNNLRKEAFMPHNYPEIADNYNTVGYTGHSPQEIEFEDNYVENNKKGYLWYINRNNCDLIHIDWNRVIDKAYAYDYDYLKANLVTTHHTNSHYWYYFFYALDRKNIPPLGFFIFQLWLDHNVWDDYEYQGDIKLKKISYRSGLNKNLFEIYSDPSKQWWEKLGDEVKNMKGIPELSYLTLDTDLMSWLTVAPSHPAYNYYKYFWYKEWGIDKLFPGRTERYAYYAPPIMGFDIHWNVGNEKHTITNPFNNVRIINWLIERSRKIDAVSLYKTIPIPELKKGDILASSLEYEWMKVSDYHNELPFIFTEQEIKNYLSAIKEKEAQRKIRKNIYADAQHFNFAKVPGGEYAIWGSLAAGAALAPVGLALLPTEVAITSSYVVYAVMGSAATSASTALIPTTALVPASTALVPTTTALATSTASMVPITFTSTIGSVIVGSIFPPLALLAGLIFTILGAIWLASYVEDEQRRTQIRNSVLLTSDFLGSKKIDLSILNNSLIVYAHKGKLKFGTYREYQLDLSLTESEEQIVKAVDGNKNKKAKLYTIETIDDVRLDYDSKTPFLEEHKILLLQQTYAKIRGSKNGKIFEFSKERLKTGIHYFDLKGTDWYLIYIKGKQHLVAKSDKVFINPETKLSKLDYSSIDTIPSVYDQINQKAELCFYGQTFPLNTRFGFKEFEQFNVYSQEITPEDKVMNVSQIHLLVNNTNDYINTWIKLDKPIAKAAVAEINPIEYELLKHQLEHSNLSYQQDKASNEILMEQKRISLIRRREDLNLDWWNNLTSFGTAAIKGIHTGSRTGRDTGRFAGFTTGGQISKADIIRASKFGAITGAITGAIDSIGAAAMGFVKYNIESARLKEDEMLTYRENAETMLHRKQNYEHEYRGRVLQLNGMTNTVIRGGINDREVQEQFNKLNNITNINLQISIPSPAQSVTIKYIYDYFGCECISDEYRIFPLTVKSGQIKGVYQFANLHGGVESLYTSDITLNALIRNIFESGVKFIEYEHIFLEQSGWEEFDFVPTLSPDYSDDMSHWSREKWDLYYYKKSKDEIIKDLETRPNYGLTEEELAANPSVKNATGEELLKKISEIISNREGGKIYILPAPAKSLEEQLKDLREEVAVKTNEITQLKNQINESNVDGLNTELNDVKEQLRQCKINLTNLQKTKEFCDKTNAAFIKELEKAKRKCEAELAAKKAEIELGKQGVTVKEGEIESLNQKISDLEQKVKECESLKQQLDNEIKQHKIDKEELEQKLNDERRRAINEKEEINKLNKQLEESSIVDPFEIQKNTKFDFSKYSSSCELMQYILNEPYSFDIKDRDNGWNPFKDLLVHIGSSLLFARKADVDQKVMEIDHMRPIVEKLVELENTPIMSKLMDIMTLPTWWKYAEYINQGKNKGTDVDTIQTKIDEWSEMQTDVIVNGVKAILDELNYLVYKAKSKIKAENIPENRDVEVFFDLVYPSTHNLWYKHAFGSYDIALSKKIFTRDINCVDRMTARDVKKSKWYEVGLSLAKSIEEAQTIFVPGESDEYKPWIPGGGKVSKTFTPRFKGYKLLNNVHAIVPPLSFFEESNKPIGWDWDTPDGSHRKTWLIKYIQPPTYTYAVDSKGSATTYYEKAMYVEMYFPSHDGNHKFSNRVFLTNDFRPKKKRYEDVVKQTEELWNKRHEMTVNQDFLDKLKGGDITIIVKFNTLSPLNLNGKWKIDSYISNVKIPQETIDDFARKGYLEDFIKFLYIFDRNRIGWTHEGLDYYRQEYFRLRIATGADMKYYTKLAEPINNKQPKTRYFELGWITGSSGMYSSVQRRDSEGEVEYNALYCLNYFYRLVTIPGWFVHPWKLGEQAAYKLFSTMYRVGS